MPTSTRAESLRKSGSPARGTPATESVRANGRELQLLQLQRTAGNQAVLRLLQNPARAPDSAGQIAVQRQPQGGATHDAAATGETPKHADVSSRMAENAYRFLFHEQRRGVTRLKDSLTNTKPKKSLIASLAGGAIAGTLGVVLGPVGAAAEELVPVADVLARTVVKKLVDLAEDKAKEGASDGVAEWLQGDKEEEEKNAAFDFIDAQQKAIDRAEFESVQALLRETDEVEDLPSGTTILKGIADSVTTAAGSAAALQVVESTGAWAETVREAGDSSKAWANDDFETHTEKGDIELRLKIAKAPIQSPGDLEITGANWSGIKRDTEKLVKKQGSIKVSATGVNIRITVETPVGETRCEFLSHEPGNVIIPEKDNLQSVMIWLGQGGDRAPGGIADESGVRSVAALLGYLVGEKTVGELKFGE